MIEFKLTKKKYIAAIEGIIAQGGCSVDENNRCMYNGLNGRHCFAAQCVPKDKVQNMEEGDAFRGLNSIGILLKSNEEEVLNLAMDIHDRIAILSPENQGRYLAAWLEMAKSMENPMSITWKDLVTKCC